jgi:hypothetical protein
MQFFEAGQSKSISFDNIAEDLPSGQSKNYTYHDSIRGEIPLKVSKQITIVSD